MLRHLALAAFASAVAAGPLPPLPSLGLLEPPPDELTVAVSGSGSSLDGTYTLECAPPGGSHPKAAEACARLDRLSGEKEDPFAPVSKRQFCTMVDGGPARARITGTWRGKRIDASYDRKNGCEINRWKELEPVLPTARS
ncbi:SSI family serine proteinase inhibitor [Streptomyces sp. NPDC101118]|uniref:SSI family serine proteinase inhibitor n=1 Tax=Streptomyces sp. NPDC101118 TaxID=3366109 RepID=UPI00382FF9EC